MQWSVGVTFFAGFCVAVISSRALEESQHDGSAALDNCTIICNPHNNDSNRNKSSNSCQCTANGNESQIGNEEKNDDDQAEKKINKRDTVQELLKKINQKKAGLKKVTPLSTRLRNVEYPKKSLIKYKSQPKKADLSMRRNVLHKDFENRLKEMRARVSGHPLLKARGNIEPDDKSKLLGQFKIRQEELLEKFKKASSISARQSNDVTKNTGSLSRLQNRINLPSPKVGTGIKSSQLDQRSKIENSDLATPESKSTTELPKHSSMIVIKSSTATPPAPLNNDNHADDDNADVKEVSSKKSDALPLAIERLKEKQKETVLKIKDKISQSKSKPTN